ncbi:MAG TPA: hypothetical protein VFQ36_19420, partial [Ktedonobacteraceae bacterium]|nr:hypothetical protein [Ktedonobacteraceae bacterium]
QGSPLPYAENGGCFVYGRGDPCGRPGNFKVIHLPELCEHRYNVNATAVHSGDRQSSSEHQTNNYTGGASPA